MPNLTVRILIQATAGNRNSEMLLRQEHMSRNLDALQDYKVDDLRDVVQELWSGEAKPIVQMTVKEIIDDLLSNGCEQCGEEVKLITGKRSKKSVCDGPNGSFVCIKCAAENATQIT